MITENIKSEIGDLLRNEGTHFFGVSAVKQLDRVPQELSPEALLPDARSVIIYAIPIPKGIMYAKDNALALYWRYCNMSYRNLDFISHRLCLFLEERGSSATPMYSCFPWKVVNREFWGLLPLVYWGEEAGLGRLAKCGLLVTPDYGTRILLGGAITTQELEPDERLIEELCPADCFQCTGACPVNAIARSGKVDHNLCTRRAGSTPLMSILLKDQSVRQNFSFETLLNTAGVDDHSMYTCFECLRACPLNKK
jgi:epoxyqueuosine reductase QueG